MNVEDGVGSFRLAVDPAQDVQVRFNGIAVEQLVEEPTVAVVLACIGRECHIHVPHAGLALEGLETPPENPADRPHLNPRP